MNSMNLMKDSQIEARAACAGTVIWDSGRDLGFDDMSLLFSSPVTTLSVPPDGTEKDLETLFLELERGLNDGLFAAGWIAYEAGYLLIPKLRQHLLTKRPNVPLAWFGLYEKPELFHPKDTPLPPGHHSPNISLKLDTTREQFIRAIDKIHDYIRSGDTYQINYTIRGHFPFHGNAFDLYQTLKQRQQVGYSAFIHPAEGLDILSLSPELFFKKRGRKIQSKPMKGTAKRGKDPEEDKRIERELGLDEKNRAENVMIVDLLRNDLGRICETGSVKVPELFKVERYQTLFQMISTVEGLLSKGTRWSQIFRALFPCGSITGAPKIRSMEIIAEIENTPRGIYTGAIGVITPQGDCVFNVAIRTITIKEGQGEIGIGAGITIGSSGIEEFEETVLKARFLTQDIT